MRSNLLFRPVPQLLALCGLMPAARAAAVPDDVDAEVAVVAARANGDAEAAPSAVVSTKVQPREQKCHTHGKRWSRLEQNPMVVAVEQTPL